MTARSAGAAAHAGSRISQPGLAGFPNLHRLSGTRRGGGDCQVEDSKSDL